MVFCCVISFINNGFSGVLIKGLIIFDNINFGFLFYNCFVNNKIRINVNIVNK